MDYNECVEYINSVEAYGSQDAAALVDIYDLGPAIDLKEYGGKDAEKLIALIDTAEGIMPQKQRPELQRAAAVPDKAKKKQATKPPEPLQEPMQPQPQPEPAQPAPAIQAPKQPKPTAVPAPKVSKSRNLSAKAAKELAGMMGKAGEEISSALKPAPRSEKLVLVHLSLQDQVGELEKISMGLDGGAFDTGQMAIIRIEVRELMKNKGRSTGNDFQKELYNMRNERLGEVAAKLGF